MRKTLTLTHPKFNSARLVDAIKHDIKKYIARERRKPLPEGMDYWTFECRFGPSEDTATPMFNSEINIHIDAAVDQGLAAFYVEILAKAAKQNRGQTATKPKLLGGEMGRGFS